MLNSTEKIIDSNLAKHAFGMVELEQLFDGTPASRHGLLNKALKKKELVRLKRGVYTLAPKYTPIIFSAYYLANQIVPHSYVSLETALAFHGLIPEYVPSVNSVITQNRKQHYDSDYGTFCYYAIPVNPYTFLMGVVIESQGEQTFLMASAVRALADLVYTKKIDWQGLDFLLSGLRIELSELKKITPEEFDMIQTIYRSKRVLHFFKKLKKVMKR